MPSVYDFNRSKYLKKEDCDPPILVTIKDFKAVNMARSGEEEDMKWVLEFEEDVGDFSLGSITNQNTLTEMAGTKDLTQWIGMKVVLYVNPDVEYGGRRVGGIRVRPPKQGYIAPEPEPSKEGKDDIPF